MKVTIKKVANGYIADTNDHTYVGNTVREALTPILGIITDEVRDVLVDEGDLTQLEIKEGEG